MTNSEMVREMLTKQSVYDQAVLAEHKTSHLRIGHNIDTAILDEVGELKSYWCWWKHTQKPANPKKVLEELVDVWHFMLMKLLMVCDEKAQETFCRQFDIFSDRNTVDSPRNACLRFIKRVTATDFDEYRASYGIRYLTAACGFCTEDVYNGYLKKNAENYQRIRDGY